MSILTARRSPGGRVLLYAFLLALLVVFALPLLWALSASFKSRADIFGYPPSLLPNPAVLANYRGLLEAQPFWSWFTISTVVAVISTAVSVLLCSLAGFAFAKYRFRGRNALFTIMFSSLAVPFAVIVVPLFIMVAKARLTEPYFSLVVPWVAPAFGIFMMRQFTEQAVPDELLDAARMDGCTEFGLFRRVVLPLLRPALGHWVCGRSSTATTACSGRSSSSVNRRTTRCPWGSRPCSAPPGGSTTWCSPDPCWPPCRACSSSSCCASNCWKASPPGR